MAKWKRTISLQPQWDQAKKQEITIQNLAGFIANKLSHLRRYGDDYAEFMRQGFIDDLICLARDETADAGDFDTLWHEIYNWADSDHTLWIDIITRRQ